MYHIFSIHSSIDGHLGCLCVSAVVNSAAVNIGVHVSFWIRAFDKGTSHKLWPGKRAALFLDGARCQGSEHWGVGAQIWRALIISQEPCRETGWEEQWPRSRDTAQCDLLGKEPPINTQTCLSPSLPFLTTPPRWLSTLPLPVARAYIRGQFPRAQEQGGEG